MADVKTFGVMLFEGFEVLDVSVRSKRSGFSRIEANAASLTVAERAGAVTSAQGPKVIADFSFTESGFTTARLSTSVWSRAVLARAGKSAINRARMADRARAEGRNRRFGLHRRGAAGEGRAARRAARDQQQALVQVGDGAGAEGQMGERGALGRRRKIPDLVGSVGRHRHGACDHRAHHRPRRRRRNRDADGIRMASRRRMGSVREDSPTE